MPTDILPIHRRESRRRAIRLECEGVRERGFRPVARAMLDVSPEGAFIASDATDVELGEEVWLTFRLPREGAWMDARARVVRYGRETWRGDAVRGLGVEFIALDHQDRDRLTQSLVGVPPPIPLARRPMDYAGFVRDVDEGAP